MRVDFRARGPHRSISTTECSLPHRRLLATKEGTAATCSRGRAPLDSRPSDRPTRFLYFAECATPAIELHRRKECLASPYPRCRKYQSRRRSTGRYLPAFPCAGKKYRAHFRQIAPDRHRAERREERAGTHESGSDAEDPLGKPWLVGPITWRRGKRG